MCYVRKGNVKKLTKDREIRMKKNWTFEPPANFGPTEQEGGGGRRDELLHLTEDFFVSHWGRERGDRGKSKKNQSEKRRRTSKALCLPARGERGEERRTVETQEDMFRNEFERNWGLKSKGCREERERGGRWTFAPVYANLASLPGRQTDTKTRTINLAGWRKKK